MITLNLDVCINYIISIKKGLQTILNEYWQSLNIWNTFSLKEQGWCSGKSTHLPTMWPE